MNKNQELIRNIFVVIIILISLITIFIFQNNNITTTKSTITQYDYTKYVGGGYERIKQINIDNKNDLNKLTNFVRKIKPVEQQLELALLNEVEIKYNDSITISLQLNEKEYCNYYDTKKNISKLSYIPEGLYEWVEEKLNLK